MSRTAFRQPLLSDYTAVVDRVEEMEQLRARAQNRRSMLIFGPAGVGKTRLLREFVKTQPLALYVQDTSSPRELLLALLAALRATSSKHLRLPVNVKTLSTSSLKGVVQRSLDILPAIMVLDQLSGPSRVLTRMIKELNYYDRTPVYFAARTSHMEDIGTLQPLCADRSERVELKNLPSPIALEFVYREANKGALAAANLDEAIHSIAEWSEGNPRGILQMLTMAQLPKYRLDDQIKTHVLYLDFRMGRACDTNNSLLRSTSLKSLTM